MSLAAVLDAATDDTLLAIAIALPTPADLLWLALTCHAAAQRFYFTATSYRSGGSAVPSGAASGGTAAAQQEQETWSIIEEAARQWVASCTDQERGWVPRRGRERWLGLMWEVESLRRGAVFGRSHEYITLSEGGLLATSHARISSPRTYTYFDTASKVVMRAGRHYVQFTVSGSGSYGLIGVIRPGWDVEEGLDASEANGHCFYYTADGSHMPGHRHWEGRQGAIEDGDHTGMLLDLDQGSMTVYKNHERLGVMATGLSGEYSWAAELCYQGTSARIEAAPAPGSPTAEQLAQAVAYIAAHATDDDY
eukprot:COSAG06_NODE_2868_length_6151_cov_6.454891_3_plen_308_part_00